MPWFLDFSKLRKRPSQPADPGRGGEEEEAKEQDKEGSQTPGPSSGCGRGSRGIGIHTAQLVDAAPHVRTNAPPPQRYASLSTRVPRTAPGQLLLPMLPFHGTPRGTEATHCLRNITVPVHHLCCLDPNSTSLAKPSWKPPAPARLAAPAPARGHRARLR